MALTTSSRTVDTAACAMGLLKVSARGHIEGTGGATGILANPRGRLPAGTGCAVAGVTVEGFGTTFGGKMRRDASRAGAATGPGVGACLDRLGRANRASRKAKNETSTPTTPVATWMTSVAADTPPVCTTVAPNVTSAATFSPVPRPTWSQQPLVDPVTTVRQSSADWVIVPVRNSRWISSPTDRPGV
ncbi:hypothetical protein GCM10023321_23220 [Pseudonocardia eucalypti]|uniref:Uncharacterized protein n=1 Tax=Pseudonocardia eucalypti TaxID=648755 RepID=A0ABP9PWU8_9PSEU